MVSSSLNDSLFLFVFSSSPCSLSFNFFLNFFSSLSLSSISKVSLCHFAASFTADSLWLAFRSFVTSSRYSLTLFAVLSPCSSSSQSSIPSKRSFNSPSSSAILPSSLLISSISASKNFSLILSSSIRFLLQPKDSTVLKSYLSSSHQFTNMPDILNSSKEPRGKSLSFSLCIALFLNPHKSLSL